MLFPVAINVAEIGVPYKAIAPDVADCLACGASIEEVTENIKIEICTRLKNIANGKGKIPTPSSIHDHLRDPKFAIGFIWVLIDIDMSLSLGKPIKYNVSMSEQLTHRIDVAVKKNKNFKCRSSFLAEGAVLLLSKIE